MVKRYEDYTCVLILVLGVLWFCRDLVVSEAVPFFRDLTNYFYPLRYSLYESYRAGELPLWDRHFAQGFPNLAAFQSGAFYPPHFIFFFLTFYVSVRALFIFHFLIAAIGTYVLLRRWDYSRDLALIGALLFTLGGVIVSLTNLLNHYQSAVWLPLLILKWERVLLTPRWSNFVYFTFTAALQLLAGSPEIFGMSMGLVLLDGIRILESEPRISWRRVFSLALGGNILMLAVIMAQILPTAELMLESRRGQSIPAAEAFMWSLNPFSLLNLFFLDKEVDLGISTGIRLFFTRQVPFLVSSYLGMISLFGIGLWIYYGARREKLILTALAIGSLAMALGGNAPVYPFLFQHLPFASAIRFPEKFFFLTHSFLFLMAMRGLKGLMLDHTTRLRIPMIILSSICVAWLTVYCATLSRSDIVAEFIATNSNIPPLSDIHGKATVSVLTNLQRQLILSLALFFLLALVKTNRIRPFLFSVLLVSVVYVDLAWAHRSFLFPIHPDQLHRTPPVIQLSGNHRSRYFYYPGAHDLHPAFVSVIGRPTFEQAVALSFQNLLPNVGVRNGIDYFQEIDALNRRTYSDFLKLANGLEFERQVQLLRTFNVEFLVSFRELPQQGTRFVRHFPEYFSWLYTIDGTVPRAYVVDNTVVEKDPRKILEKLSDPQFDPLRNVVLSQRLPIRSTRLLKGHAKIKRYDNNLVVVQANADKDAILVLADSFYPGWKAFVDGRDAKIFRANYFYRAVVLPKGEHRVEFKYEPLSVQIGLLISCLAFTGIGLVSICLFIQQRRLAARMSPVALQTLQN